MSHTDEKFRRGLSMKIFMFLSNFLPHLGGLEFYVHDVASALAQNWNDETHIFCFDDVEKAYELHPQYTVHRIKRLAQVGGVFSIPSPLSLVRVLRTVMRISGKPDQVWTHTRFFVSSMLGVVFAKFLGIRVLHVEHGSTHVVHSKRAIFIFARIWDHIFGRIVLSVADSVVVVSPQAVAFVQKLGARRVSFVPAGTSEQFFNDKQPIYKMPEVPALLFVGRLLPGKGVENLLRALAASVFKQATLEIIGDGPQRCELERLAVELGLSHRVRFHGAIARDKLPRWYRNASIFVNPSFSEGGPLTVLEALAMGVPVVSTPVGCVAKYLEASGGQGLLTQGFNFDDLAKALDKAISYFSLQDRDKCSQNIRKAFSWTKIAGTIRALGDIPE